jgi:hypothetical protein
LLVTWLLLAAAATFWATRRKHDLDPHWLPPVPRLPNACKEARLTTLGEALPGEYVAISARVMQTGEALESPFTGLPCFVYNIDVYDDETRELVARRARACSFVIEDRTGRALVETENIEIRLRPSRPVVSRLERTIENVFADAALPTGRPFSAFETRVRHGEWVIVVGTMRRLDDMDGAAYRSSATPTSMAVVGTAERPLVITDLFS